MGRCREAGGDVEAGMRKKKSPSKMPRPLISTICLLLIAIVATAATLIRTTSVRLFVSSNISLAFNVVTIVLAIMPCPSFFYLLKDYFYCNQRKSLGKTMLVMHDDGDAFSSHQITTHRGRYLQQITQPPSPPHAMCVERIYAVGNYTAVAEFPDGSGRLLLVSQDGKMVWLVTFFRGGGAARTLFLDLSDMVVSHGADGMGIKGIAFDLDFMNNSRYYVSLTCDSASSSKCGAAAAGAKPQRYRYWLLVAMFSAKGSMGMTKTFKPKEMMTIYKVALPPSQEVKIYGLNQGGQIFLNQYIKDGYIYVAIGHGVIETATGLVDFSSDMSTALGKVVRIQRYIYKYGSDLRIATESPKGSGQYISTKIATVGCSVSSPSLSCDPKGAAAIVEFIHYIGEDNNGNALFLATKGIYRVVHPTLCHNSPDPADGTNLSSLAHHRQPLTWIQGLLTCLTLVFCLPRHNNPLQKSRDRAFFYVVCEIFSSVELLVTVNRFCCS
uniref:Glucose/Sorbosone dehydrogenase domain-containing protein n=1 Tax=Oryza punctata TaxID=4537 RepID=A0A0E0MNI7_ORYPU